MLPLRKVEQGDNHERWLISYADFITLLCALFVVLYATSSADRLKAKQMAESFRRTSQQTEKAPPDASFGQTLEWLKSELRDELADGRLDLRLERRGLVVSMREASCFPVGDAAVTPEAFPVIAKIADIAKRLNCPIRLEGHTDSLPVRGGRYRNNWELSAARSISVMEILVKRFGIPKERLGVAGYADNFPIDSNDSEAGRSRNRRVDIVFLGDEALRTYPHAELTGRPGSGASAPR